MNVTAVFEVEASSFRGLQEQAKQIAHLLVFGSEAAEWTLTPDEYDELIVSMDIEQGPKTAHGSILSWTAHVVVDIGPRFR